jgi:hypothetical protein
MFDKSNVLKMICTVTILAFVFMGCASDPEPIPVPTESSTVANIPTEDADVSSDDTEIPNDNAALTNDATNIPDNSEEVSDNEEVLNNEFKLQVENNPEGLLFTVDNIPRDITTIFINVYEGEYNPVQWSDAFAMILGPKLDELKVTKRMICPFVKTGQQYAISFDVIRNGKVEHITEVIDIQTENGNPITNDIELQLNDEQTGVTLSAEPEFSSEVEFELPKYDYILLGFNDESTSTSTYMYRGNELSYTASPDAIMQIQEYARNAGLSGDYPAHGIAVCNINYKGISWMVRVAETEEFTLSF